PDCAAFSPSGSAAVFYGAGVLTVIKGLPDAPVVANQPLDTAPASLAISDDAGSVLAAGTSVQLLRIGGGARRILESALDPQVAFAPGSHTAAVAAVNVGILLLPDGDEPESLSAPDEIPAVISGLAFTSDGRKLLLASATIRSVLLMDLSAGGVT